jgi:polyvinyl alcohol dehydrogenase (cytochrome)
MTFSFESVEPSGGILIRKRFYVPLVIAGIAWVAPAFAQTHENVRAGQSLFADHCLTCHGNPDAGQPAPDPSTLMQLTPEAIVSAITTGIMREQAKDLTDAEKRNIAEFLGGRAPGLADSGDAKTMVNHCTSDTPIGDPQAGPVWNGWGADLVNSRFQTAQRAGLSAEKVPQLKLKWAFGFPNGIDAYGQPTVASGRVFVGSDTGFVYSLNANTGCAYWSFRTDSGVRSAISIGPVKGRSPTRYAVYFGDLKAIAYALDAESGKLLWKVRIDDHVLAHVQGSPQLYGGRLYVPVSSFEENASADSHYPCCTFRGSIVALDSNTGRVIWKTYTISEPLKRTRKNSLGVQLWAPAGGAIWSSPTIDVKRQALYVGTGNAYTDPAPNTTDAIMALSLKSGKVLWVVQDTENDSFVGGCSSTNRSKDSENCPEELGPDYDFGSSPILRTLPDGHRILVAAQKSGDVYGHDPDREGALVWKKGFRPRQTFGGAADDQSVYLPMTSGGVVAVQVTNGEGRWLTPVEPAETSQPPRRGAAAAASAMPGVVFSGGWDGVLRAFSTVNGQVIWQFNTVRDFTTVNGVPAKGGSMGAPGPTIAGGLLFVGSGYTGKRNGMPGNVLLAFSSE